jgi:hypothetical protein
MRTPSNEERSFLFGVRRFVAALFCFSFGVRRFAGDLEFYQKTKEIGGKAPHSKKSI